MSSSDPLLRASYAKTVIGGIKRRPPAEQEAIFRRIGSSMREEIRGYGMLDWMPADRFAALVTAIADEVGPVVAKDFWRANLLLSLDRRLLSPLRLGAIAIYGNNPRSLLKMTPQAWELVSKHCGTCQTTDHPPSRIVLRFDAMPRVLCVPGMCLLWRGGSESCIAKLGFDGHAEADTSYAHEGVIEIHVEWRQR